MISKALAIVCFACCMLFVFCVLRACAQKTSHFEQVDTVLSTETFPLSCDILVGDVNADGEVDIDDAVYILNYSIAGGPAPFQGGYQSVRQAYVRTWKGCVVIDTLGDTLLRLIDPLEIGDVYYVPEVDSHQQIIGEPDGIN